MDMHNNMLIVSGAVIMIICCDMRQLKLPILFTKIFLEIISRRCPHSFLCLPWPSYQCWRYFPHSVQKHIQPYQSSMSLHLQLCLAARLEIIKYLINVINKAYISVNGWNIISCWLTFQTVSCCGKLRSGEVENYLPCREPSRFLLNTNWEEVGWKVLVKTEKYFYVYQDRGWGGCWVEWGIQELEQSLCLHYQLANWRSGPLWHKIFWIEICLRLSIFYRVALILCQRPSLTLVSLYSSWSQPLPTLNENLNESLD